MSVYRDAERLYHCMGDLFTWAFAEPGLGDHLRASGLSIRLNMTDPESVVSLDLGHAVIETGPDSTIAATVDLHLTADTAHDFWLGRVNVPLAVAKGTIKSKGPMAKVLMLGPLIPPLSGKYEEILRDAGLEKSLIGS